MIYEKIHRQVLWLVEEEGGMAAIRHYRENKEVYDCKSPHRLDHQGLRGKIELIDAIVKLRGSTYSVHREPQFTHKDADYAINLHEFLLGLDKRRNRIPFDESRRPD